jgi:hypothetical protein
LEEISLSDFSQPVRKIPMLYFHTREIGSLNGGIMEGPFTILAQDSTIPVFHPL